VGPQIERIRVGVVLASPDRMQPEIPLRDPQTHAVIGAGFEVNRVLGCGFLEQVYQDALALEFAERNVPFERQVGLRIMFKGRVLASFYRVDFVCFGELLVELKASVQILPIDQAQMINYLKATRFERGLILNFGVRSLEWKRFVFSEALHAARNDDLPRGGGADEGTNP
jgi:GxxExxY protein